MTIDLSKHLFDSPELSQIIANAIRFYAQTPLYLLPPTYFTGIGVYGLYYIGETFKPYSKLVDSERSRPIYIGKAVMPGSRSGNITASSQLYNRLLEHATTINTTQNLTTHDFECRFMLLTEVESGLTPAIESALIRHYKPLWNGFLKGFGNHIPGVGRPNQVRSLWDTLHPGRHWASGQRERTETIEQLMMKIDEMISSD